MGRLFRLAPAFQLAPHGEHSRIVPPEQRSAARHIQPNMLSGTAHAGAGSRESHLMRHQHRPNGRSNAPVEKGGVPPESNQVRLSTARYSADNGSMDNLTSVASLLVAGLGLGLYIMRRRVRLGKRTPRF